MRIGSGVGFNYLETFEIGDGVFIGAQAYVQGRIDGITKIGNYVWIGPQAYLDARIRSGSSSFWALHNTEPGLQRLKQDLETGEWERRYAELLTLDAYDAGYRLVVAD